MEVIKEKKKSLSKISVGLFYPDIDKNGGYPRDILRLYNELKNSSITIYKFTEVSDLVKFRKELDVVHVFGIFKLNQVLAILMCQTFGIAYVVTTFAQLMPMALDKGYLKKKLFIKVLGGNLLKRATFIHVFTKTEEAGLRQFVPQGNFKTISLGIYPEDVMKKDVAIFPKKFTQNEYLLFLGRLDIYQKGIDILIEGYAEYLRLGGNLKLIIGGRDWNGGNEFIIDKIKHINKQCLKFLGEVTEAEMDKLILNCKGFIYPSRFDGPPRPLRRALVLKKRILASYQSNLYDNLDEMGWGLSFNADSKSICEVLQKFEILKNLPIYENPNKVLGWDIISNEYQNMYLSMKNGSNLN